MGDFFPDDYNVPTESRYMRFQHGENRFRIMSKPVIGWLDWKDKKPLRYRMTEKPAKPIDPENQIKHFWAMIIWNYQTNKINILEITQGGIQKSIKALAEDQDWGAPIGYDIKVNKNGAGLDTKYKTNPVPHKAVSDEIQAAYDSEIIDLDKLFTGEDPFGQPF